LKDLPQFLYDFSVFLMCKLAESAVAKAIRISCILSKKRENEACIKRF
jgi:hypothetical protein